MLYYLKIVTNQLVICGVLYHRETMNITAHSLGVSNKVADKQFRIFYDTADWKLSREPEIKKICKEFVKLEIDLFASHINRQLDNYLSWYTKAKDKEQQLFLHAPPFIIIGGKKRAEVVVSDWST